jgi:hypothetical protein
VLRLVTATAAGTSTVVATGTKVVAAATTTAADGTATVTVTATSQSGLLSGKYRPEHAAALVDLGDAKGFGAEHAGALSMLAEAGV